MREIKFSYVWERPKVWAGPYRPDDAKVKITYMSLEDLEKGKFIRPSGYPDNNYSLLVAKRQYTGLKDKNGKEIYEGDIIRGVFNSHPQTWTVGELSAYGLTFNRLTIKPYPDSYFLRDMRHRDQWEVIGNIYENPELVI